MQLVSQFITFNFKATDLSGKNPKPELRPHAIGNSYGCNPIRCPNSEVQRDAVEALWASGVFMVVSAGNSVIFKFDSFNRVLDVQL